MRPSIRISALALFVVSCSGGGDSSPTTPPVTPPAVLSSVAVSAPSQSMVAGQTLQLAAAPKDQNGSAFSATVAWSSSSLSIATVGASGLVTGVAPGLVTITATATAGTASVTGNTQILVVAAPALTSVTISAPATSIVAGTTSQLTAAPKDQNGTAIAATVTWSSSAPAVASVNVTSGLVTGVAAGTSTITATAVAGGVTVTSTVQMTVTAAPPAAVLTSVTIAGGTSVAAGSTLALSASPRDQNGNLIAATVTWTSSAPGFATVNSTTGVVTGVAAGSTNISATAVSGGVTKQGVLAISVTGGFPLLAAVDATLGDAFSPGTVDIGVGGSVDWTFATTHNVSFSGVGAPASIPNTSGGTVRRTFNSAGTFDYSCTLHAGMIGTVIVH